MTYYYEVKEKLDKINNFKNFPIYDPLSDRNNFYLDIQKINSKSEIESVILLVIDPEIESENLKLSAYEDMYDCIMLLYKTYFFEADKKFLLALKK